MVSITIVMVVHQAMTVLTVATINNTSVYQKRGSKQNNTNNTGPQQQLRQ